MERIFKAFLNSLHALEYLLTHEKALIQEAAFFVISIPVAFFITKDWGSFLLLIGSILFVIIVEVLNTAIEACFNDMYMDSCHVKNVVFRLIYDIASRTVTG